MNAEANTLLSIRDLSVQYRTGGFLRDRKLINAVDGVSLDIKKGETLGLVGESGCGKSTLGKAILQLVKSTGGSVAYGVVDLTQLTRSSMREHRRTMQMIFQDPYASLDPRLTAGKIVAEPLRAFKLDASSASISSLMESVGLGGDMINRLPRDLSGGQRQRVGIARALATAPGFVVADEPISALDVSIQAQIMNLISRVKTERQLTILFISHDLRAVRHLSDRIAVMYMGRIVELADADSLYREPLMPYTKALLSAIPVADPEIEPHRERIILTGDVPSPSDPPSGCRFRSRCQYAVDACAESQPALEEIKPGHLVACSRISPENPYLK